MDLISQCKNKSVAYFSESFRELVDQLPQLLIDKTAAADNDMQRTRYLEAHKSIQPLRRQLVGGYQRALEQAFDDFAAGRELRPEPAQQFSQLALVDKSQYEDDVAIRTMASKASALNGEELWKLNRRFAVARGGKKCTEELNPCGPYQLCVAMRETYSALEVDPAIKLWLYQLYEQQVLAQTDSLYQTLNQQLAEQGVLKTLSFTMSSVVVRSAVGGSSQVAEAPQQRPQSEPDAANDSARLVSGGLASAADEATGLVPLVSPAVERRQTRVMDAIRAVQHKRCQSGAPRTRTAGGVSYGAIDADGVAGRADTFTQRELALALGVLQTALQLPTARQADPRRVAETEGQLIGELGAAARQNARQKLTAVDADTIDLVGMLFDYMLDDPQLPDGLKSLLSHLHTPYLKVALLDKAFFATAKHPARCLLDVMAAAGARWVREGDDDEKVYQRIRHVVERVLKEFDDDLSFFDELLKDFTRFVKVLEKRADLSTQRSVEAEKGLDQLRHARAWVGQEVARCIEGAELPAPVRELLEQPWTDYLVFTYLRHGDTSDRWRSGLDVVERVVSSVRPQGEAGTAARWRADYALLNTFVEAGFTSLGYDADEGQRLLQALRDAQAQALQGQAPQLDQQKYASSARTRGSAIARQMQQLGSEVTPKPLADSQRSALSVQEKALADKLSSVNFGTWFEFNRGTDDTGLRLKLSWYSSVSGNYMFVNHSGVKTAVKSLSELLAGMNDGSIIMLERESRNFFERAISSVLGRLNKA